MDNFTPPLTPPPPPGAGLLGNDGAVKALAFFTGMFLVGSGALAVVPEVLFRRKFGERYLTIGKIIHAMNCLAFLNFAGIFFNLVPNMAMGVLGSMFGMQQQRFNLFSFLLSLYLSPYSLIFLIVAFGHYIAIRLRRDPWDSYSNGVSWLETLGEQPFMQLNAATRWLSSHVLRDRVLYLWVEPVGMLLISTVLLSRIDPIMGSWMSGASVGMWWRNRQFAKLERQQFLDHLDSKIRSEHYGDALKGVSKRKTAGYSIAPVSKQIHEFMTGQRNQTMAESVQAAMNATPAPTPPPPAASNDNNPPQQGQQAA